MFTSSGTTRTIVKTDIAYLYDTLCKSSTCSVLKTQHQKDECNKLAKNRQADYLKDFKYLENEIHLIIKAVDIALTRLRNLGSYKTKLVNSMMFDYDKFRKEISTQLFWLKNNLTTKSSGEKTLRNCYSTQLINLLNQYRQKLGELFEREWDTIIKPYCAQSSKRCDESFCTGTQTKRWFGYKKTSCKVNEKYNQFTGHSS